MNSLVGFFESVEKLAYKILLWIILIPKTLLRIIINPTWVPDYIKGELKQDKSPFDEYISPIILMLVVALLPALIFSILPKLDVTISSPAEKETTKDGILEFDAQANFISASVRAHDKYTWYVEKIDIGKDGNFTYDENGDYYHKIYTETYEYELAESNTSNDVFFYSFENKPGSYYVNVEVQRFDIDRLDVPIEEYFSYVFVYVPEKSEDLIQISQFDETSQDTRENKLTPENFADQLTKESTILLALLLLTPPLLFALATKVLTREEISENSLKENFYIQCYYFSPSSLAIWATIYGMHFYTIDIFFYNDIYKYTMLIPLPLAMLWFINAETYAIALARKTSVWNAFIIVIVCTSIIIAGLMVNPIISFFDLGNNLRKWIIWAYPLVFYIILLGFLLRILISLLFRKKKISGSDAILIISFLPMTFMFTGTYLLGLISGPGLAATTALNTSVPTIITDTPTLMIPITTPTSVPMETSTLVSKPTTYILQRGEFPYCIARRFNVHPDQLLILSGLGNGQGIREGAPLNIPQGGSPFPGNRSLRSHPTTYTVTSSDETFFNIACLFGDVDPEAIAQTNGISTASTLSIGQQLQIP